MPETRLDQLPDNTARPARMTTIASGKGGVGKTWLSITLAHALARMGRRALLFDGDLGLANVDVQLGLMPEKDLGGVISGQATLRQSTTSYPDGGFDIIIGRSGSGSLATLPRKTLETLHDDLLTLSFDYDHIIVDLGAGLENTVQMMTQRSGAILVLTTEEPTALTDAYAFIKITEMTNPGSDLRIVVNIAESERAGEKTYNSLLKACRSFLKISPPLAGIIRRDVKVRDSIRNQTPLLTRHPNSPAATDVEAIAAELVK